MGREMDGWATTDICMNKVNREVSIIQEESKCYNPDGFRDHHLTPNKR